METAQVHQDTHQLNVHQLENSTYPYGCIQQGRLSFEDLIKLSLAPITAREVIPNSEQQDCLWQISEYNYIMQKHQFADVTVIVIPLHMFLDVVFLFMQNNSELIRPSQCYMYAPSGLLAKLRGPGKVNDVLQKFKVIFVADRHLKSFAKELKQTKHLQQHPCRLALANNLNRLLGIPEREVPEDQQLQNSALQQIASKLQEEFGRLPNTKGDFVQYLHDRIPLKQTTFSGVIPKRMIYINPQAMSTKLITSNYTWFISVPQGTYYAFRKSNQDMRKFYKVSELNTQCFSDPRPHQQVEVSKERAYMFHVNSNSINIKIDMKHVKQQKQYIAKHLATLLQGLNATVMPIKPLFEVIRKDLVFQQIVKKLLDGSRVVSAPTADVSDFTNSTSRLECELSEPCSICFKGHYLDSIPVITTCCYKILCYDCFASTCNSTNACPFCRKESPFFPPQRYYIPLLQSSGDTHLPQPNDTEFYNLFISYLTPYIQSGRSEGYTRVLVSKLIRYMHEIRASDESIKCIIQCCKESQLVLTMSAVVCLQLAYQFKSDANFKRNLFYSIDALDLVQRNSGDSDDGALDISWWQPYTLVDKPQFFDYCSNAIYLGKNDGVDATDLKKCTHLITFAQDCVDSIDMTIKDPMSAYLALRTQANFPLKKIDFVQIPAEQMISIDILER